jgi:hypothetical protein
MAPQTPPTRVAPRLRRGGPCPRVAFNPPIRSSPPVWQGQSFALFERRPGYFLAAIASAAHWIAFTMLWYPVQRHRLPSSWWRICSSEGFG